MIIENSEKTGYLSDERYPVEKSQKTEIINLGILKGYYPFSGFQRQRLWWGVGQSPTYSLISAQQRVNFKTVRWTVLKEGTPCKIGRSLMNSYFLTRLIGYLSDERYPVFVTYFCGKLILLIYLPC